MSSVTCRSNYATSVIHLQRRKSVCRFRWNKGRSDASGNKTRFKGSDVRDNIIEIYTSSEDHQEQRSVCTDLLYFLPLPSMVVTWRLLKTQQTVIRDCVRPLRRR